MPTFDNGWICRQCWCSNREFDGRCYRCHADRDPATVRTEPKWAAAPAPEPEAAPHAVVTRLVSPTPTPTPAQAVVPATAPARATPAIACGHCHQPLAGDERFCTKCGTATTLPAMMAGVAQPVQPGQTPQPATRHQIVIPNPAAAMRGAYQRSMARLRSVAYTLTAPVRAVRRFAQNVAMSVRGIRDGARNVRQNANVVLFVAWVALMAVAALLFAGLGGPGSAFGIAGAFAMVLTVGAFSAVTAAVTIVMLGGRLADRADAGQRMRDEVQGPSPAMVDRRAI
jgi:uncharacterized membrane protein